MHCIVTPPVNRTHLLVVVFAWPIPVGKPFNRRQQRRSWSDPAGRDSTAEQIILSGILPVFGNRIDGYRNSKRMAINMMVKRLCKEEDVGYMDLWDSFVGKEGMYARDGLHLSGKGAAVFAEGLSGAVASGLGKVRYLN